MTKEIWKDVIAYEGIYKVSNLGRVKRIGNGSDGRKLSERIMNQKASGWKGKYLSVVLTKNNESKNQYVHRLVGIAFYGMPKNNKTQINHIDGNKHNNCLNNLEWVTAKENQQHRYTILNQSQNGENNAANKYPRTLIEKVISLYKTKNYKQREIAKITGIDYRYVNLIVHNKVWKHLKR